MLFRTQHGNNLSRHSRQGYLVASLIVTTFIIGSILFIFRPQIVPQPVQRTVPEVTTITAQSIDTTIPIATSGLLQPARTIQLISAVNGTITFVSEKLATGALFNAGDVLLRIDPRIAELELQKAKIQLEQAKLNLATTTANIRSQPTSGNTSELAQGKPQLALAQAQLDAAQIAYDLALFQRQQTTIVAPFSGRVLANHIQAIEQLVVGTPIAQIYALNPLQVRLPITQQQYQLLNQTDASTVTLTDTVTKQTFTGKILHSEGVIAANRLIYLTAVLDASENTSTLLMGSLINAQIPSALFSDIFIIPESALRSGNTLWLLSANHQLQIQHIDILYRTATHLYIKSGIHNGDKIIISPLTLISEGMPLAEATISER